MYKSYNDKTFLTQYTTMLYFIQKCVEVCLEGHPYCVKCAQHYLQIFKIIGCFDSTLKWFILRFIHICKNQPIHRTDLTSIKVRKCGLIYGIKYPLLTKRYDSKIYW